MGKDVGICAFADEKWAKYSGPGITCIEQHPFSMGEAAARLLFDKIEHKEKKEVVYEEIKADICRYESTKIKINQNIKKEEGNFFLFPSSFFMS